MTPQEAVVAIALAEVGYKEKKTNAMLDDFTANAGNGNFTKYARDLDAVGTIYNYPKNGYDWCDIFADWCYWKAFGTEKMMEITGQKYKGVGAGCGYSVNYYRSIGRFFKKNESNPQPADQIFYQVRGSISHTGIVISFDGKFITTVEGNTGEQVKKMHRNINDSYVYGWGRPMFELVSPSVDGIEQGGKKKVTFEEWMEHYNKFRAELQKKECSDWAKPFCDESVELGIFAGDNYGNFMWKDFITREQAATILIRFRNDVISAVMENIRSMEGKIEM